MVSTRKLQANPKLLLDVIKRQCGSLEKAVLEGIMNAFEAESEFVEITFTENDDGFPDKATLIIEDAGKGFQSEEQIHAWFETFGTPHEASENKIWAQFRMGRGQMFAFGRNTWRTGEFEMVVDVDKNGLEYELQKGLDHFPGCRIEIELYTNPIGGSYASVAAFKSKIKRQIEFMDGEIFFNKERLNIPASECNWDIETDDAYFMFGKGTGLTFYNLGALVMQHSPMSAGVTGVVVSKEQLKVNFARNDIQHDCEVYKRISKVVTANRVKRARKSPRRLDNNQKVAMLCDLRDGVVQYSDVCNLSLITLTNDKVVTLDYMKKVRHPWTFAPSGDHIADNLLVADQAVCISDDITDLLDYSGDEKEFFNWLLNEAFRGGNYSYRNGLKKQWSRMYQLYAPFETDYSGEIKGLSEGISRTLDVIPAQNWTTVEKRVIKALEKIYSWGGRALGIGSSETALAWTDGQSYIRIARQYIKRIRPDNLGGASHLIMTMFHELAHGDTTIENHHHDQGFYKAFHDLVAGEGRWSSPCQIMVELPRVLRGLKAEEWDEKQIKKQVKAKKARDKALGLTVKTAAKAAKTTVTTTTLVKPTRKPTNKSVVIGVDGRKHRRR